MKCRLIEQTGTRASLRIYWGDSRNRECPVKGYHNAEKYLTDSPDPEDRKFAGQPKDHADPAEWPTHCDGCGAPVPAGFFLNESHRAGEHSPQYQVFYRRLYNTASGKPEPGDVYWAPWYHDEDKQYRCQWDNCDDPRGHLIVILPNGAEWDVDSRASNCDMREDRTHRCWVRHGEPPNLHVDKSGHTCNAGAGSILNGNYHGFLHNGELTNR